MRALQHTARVCATPIDRPWRAVSAAKYAAPIRALELELAPGPPPVVGVISKRLGGLLARDEYARVSRLIVSRAAAEPPLAVNSWLGLIAALFAAGPNVKMLSLRGWAGVGGLHASQLLRVLPPGGALRIVGWRAEFPQRRGRAVREGSVYREGGKVVELVRAQSSGDCDCEYDHLTHLSFFT